MEKEKFEKLPAEYRADLLKNQESIFFNAALFEQAQRIAQMFAESTMVPKHFRGNIGNCMIGLNYAARINADPFMVLQNMYEVHGRPGIEGKLVEALINQSGKYSEPLQYDWLDSDDKVVARKEVLNKKDGQYGCQAWTIDRKSNKRVDGPKIHWDLVKGMGWYDKPGPDGNVKSNMWRNNSEMMFYYRAASWFANKNCPEVKLGMATKEELEESIIEIRQEENPLKIKGISPESITDGKNPYEIKDAPTNGENGKEDGEPTTTETNPNEALIKDISKCRTSTLEKMHDEWLQGSPAVIEAMKTRCKELTGKDFDIWHEMLHEKEKEGPSPESGEKDPINNPVHFKEKYNSFRAILGEKVFKETTGGKDSSEFKAWERGGMIAKLNAEVDKRIE